MASGGVLLRNETPGKPIDSSVGISFDAPGPGHRRRIEPALRALTPLTPNPSPDPSLPHRERGK
ncbi:MAG TPA: hypothetical protein VF789_00885 [Thermoanaerobaculia bacterium]